MKKRYIGLLLLLCILLWQPCIGHAQETVTIKNKNIASIKMGGKVIARKIDSHTYQFINQKSASKNREALNKLLHNNKKKIVNLPKETIKIDSVIAIGSNTVLNAQGATILGTNKGRGLVINSINSSASTIKYNLVRNVTINGGKWKNKSNSKAISLFRFAHGKNITIKNASITTNYKSHGIELIACSDCRVDHCKVIATNSKTKSSSSVEEAIQIDIATKTTAPGVFSEGGHKSKYVKGQTCQNITINDCTALSSRGICVNLSKGEGGKWKNKIHHNITITNCNTTGSSAEGLMVFNTTGLNVANNKITSKSTRGNSYSTGFHIVNFAKNSALGSKETRIIDNRIYGKYYGLAITSKTSSKWGKTRIEDNHLYCKRGKGNALVIGRGEVKSVHTSGNCYYKW